jgi:HK97 family phage portal protein
VILSSRAGNRELRLFEASALIPPPGSRMALTGTALRAQQLGVAAVSCAVQLVSESLGIPVMRVYTGDAEKRRPLLNAPQAQLFQEPAEGDTSFDLWQDVSTSIELEQGAFLWKNMDPKTREVYELVPMDPRFFTVTRPQANAPRVIKARIDGIADRDVTDKVIFIRGWTPVPGGAAGLSKLMLHDLPLRNALKLEEYKGRYFDNDGTPGVILDASGSNPTRVQREELLESWAQRHSGQPGKPGMIWGDVKGVEWPSPTLEQAQAVDLANAVALDVARMWRIYPAELLHAVLGRPAPPKSAELWADLFLRFSLLHRMRRIERAISADRDVFPDRKQYARFDIEELLRGDIATIAAMIHDLVQVGVLNPNEGRAYLGKGPRPGGDKYLETPVGAKANSNAADGGDDETEEPGVTG